MSALDDLIAPYQRFATDARGALYGNQGPSGLDMISGMLLSQSLGGGRQRRAKMPNLPDAAGGDTEIFYGGNRFNPSSVDSTHGGHLHFALPGGPVVKVGRKLQRLGFDVGEHPKFGGVAPVHTSGSHHYNRDAIDVNYNGGGRWASEDQALGWLERMLVRRYG